MIGFEGSSSWSLDILCGQSVSINRGLYIRVHNFQCPKLLFRFNFVLKGRIERDLNQFLTVCKGHHNRGNDT
jgi:hypothetical protein